MPPNDQAPRYQLVDPSTGDVVGSVFSDGNGNVVIADETDTQTTFGSDGVTTPALEATNSITDASGTTHTGELADLSDATSLTVEATGPIFTSLIESSTSLASLNTSRFEHGVAPLNDLNYAIGGISGVSRTKSVEEYDPATDTWTSVSSLPNNRSVAKANEANGFIYYTAGNTDTNYEATVLEYDKSGNSWSTKSSMTTGRANHGQASYNDILYVSGGQSSSNNYLFDVEKYDAPADSWSNIKDMPIARQNHASVALDGYIYVIGGTTSTDGTNPDSVYAKDVRRYDISADTWSSVASLNTGRRNLTAVASNGRIWAMGGQDSSGFLSSIEKYNPSEDSWATASNGLATARQSAGSVADNNTIYTYGGENGGGDLSSHESHDVSKSAEKVFDATELKLVGVEGANAEVVNQTRSLSRTGGQLLAENGDSIAVLINDSTKLYSI